MKAKVLQWLRYPLVKRLVILALLLSLLHGMKAWVKTATLVKDVEALSYGELQRRRLSQPIPSTDVVLVDLYPLISPRRSGQLSPSLAVQEELIGQFITLRRLLEGLIRIRPRAVMVDWELVLPPALRRSQGGGRFGYHPQLSKEFRQAYEDLLRSLQRLHREGIPVIVGAWGYQPLRAQGEPMFPIDLHELTVASLGLLVERDGVSRVALMREGTGTHLPSLTDALIRLLEDPRFPDRVRLYPSRMIVFEAIHRDVNASSVALPNETYWIDYRYAPDLLRNAILAPTPQDATAIKVVLQYGTAFSPKEKMWEARLSKLRDKVIILADLSSSSEQSPDKFNWPVDELAQSSKQAVTEALIGAGLSYDEASRHPAAQEIHRRVPGGLIHASAFLTRTQAPIYSLPSGLHFWIFLFLFNAFVMVIIYFLTRAFAGWFVHRLRDKHTREEMKEVVHSFFEALGILGITLLFIFPVMSGFLAKHDLFIPQYTTVAMTRFVDLVLVIYGLGAILLNRYKQSRDAGTVLRKSS